MQGSYFNPFSKRFNSVAGFRTLPLKEKGVTVLATTLVAALLAIPTFGIGSFIVGVAVFRKLVDNYTVKPIDLANKEQQEIAKKVEEASKTFGVFFHQQLQKTTTDLQKRFENAKAMAWEKFTGAANRIEVEKSTEFRQFVLKILTDRDFDLKTDQGKKAFVQHFIGTINQQISLDAARKPLEFFITKFFPYFLTGKELDAMSEVEKTDLLKLILPSISEIPEKDVPLHFRTGCCSFFLQMVLAGKTFLDENNQPQMKPEEISNFNTKLIALYQENILEKWLWRLETGESFLYRHVLIGGDPFFTKTKTGPGELKSRIQDLLRTFNVDAPRILFSSVVYTDPTTSRLETIELKTTDSSYDLVGTICSKYSEYLEKTGTKEAHQNYKSSDLFSAVIEQYGENCFSDEAIFMKLLDGLGEKGKNKLQKNLDPILKGKDAVTQETIRMKTFELLLTLSQVSLSYHRIFLQNNLLNPFGVILEPTEIATKVVQLSPAFSALQYTETGNCTRFLDNPTYTLEENLTIDYTIPSLLEKNPELSFFFQSVQE